MMLTMQDPAIHRTLVRLAWCKRWMRRNNVGLAIDGAPIVPAAKTDITITLRKHGWRPAKKRRAA